jgi:hypothetical protein
MAEPAASPSAINIDAVRFRVREALKALEADVDGERIRDVETNLRTAAALLHSTKVTI